MFTRWPVLGIAVTILALASCCGSDEPTPTAVLSAAELARWETDANAFADRYYGAWPDVDQTFAEFADDATFYDPTSEDVLVEGKDSIVAMWRPFFMVYSDIDAQKEGVFLSADGAAFPVTLFNVWPPWTSPSPDHPPMDAVEVLMFDDGLATALDIWYAEATLEATDTGCFAAAGCTSDLRAIADRYVTAWSSGDPAQISALYGEDAVFTDTMFGLEAQGADAIGDLAEKRFGARGANDLEVVALNAMTKGPSTAASLPEMGRTIGVSIHYLWTIDVAGEPAVMESLTTLDLGTRGSPFELNPDGLITREVVFHHPGSVAKAGMTG